VTSFVTLIEADASRRRRRDSESFEQVR